MLDREKLIEDFQNSNHELVQLNPEIYCSSLDKQNKDDEPNRLDKSNWEIVVKHDFIFDNRLVPDNFCGFKVENLINPESYPNEFPSSQSELPLEDWYAPKNYIDFVENHFDESKDKLRNHNLTKRELLDALTGDFNKHIKWCIGLRSKRIEDEKENIAFFYKLLYKIKQAYLDSDVRNINKDWKYSLTSTKLSKNKPLIVGFNYGAEENYQYNEQTNYPFAYFSGLYDELASFKKVVALFHEYFTQGLYATQTNICFFRSKKEAEISKHDLELCKPIFYELVNYLNPQCIISFTRKDFLLLDKKTEIKTIEIPSNNKTLYVSKGKILVNSSRIDYYNLPHPNSHFTTESRIKAWEYCFK